MIILVCYNCDCDQSLRSFVSPEAAMRDIVCSFDIGLDPGDPAVCQRVMDTYEARDWKGFTIHLLDPGAATTVEIAIEDLNAAAASNHARLDFERKFAAHLAA